MVKVANTKARDVLIGRKIAAKWHGYTLLNRRLRSGVGTLPQVVVVGAQRSGSTSMYELLASHPEFLASTRKEVHYFDLNAGRPIEWYKAHFLPSGPGDTRIPFEITPYYLYHGGAIDSLLGQIPTVKMLVLLRNPVNRMVSHVQHSIAKGYEVRSLDQALRRSADGYDGEHQIRDFPKDRSFYVDLDHYTRQYVQRSDYAAQLRTLYSAAPREQVHVVDSDALFRSDAEELQMLAEFLNVDFDGRVLPHANTAVVRSGSEDFHDIARSIATDLNGDLSRVCGRSFTWQ